MVFICDFCEKICVIRVLNKKTYFLFFQELPIFHKNKSRKIPAYYYLLSYYYNPITGIDNIKIFSFSSRPSRGSMIPGLLG